VRPERLALRPWRRGTPSPARKAGAGTTAMRRTGAAAGGAVSRASIFGLASASADCFTSGQRRNDIYHRMRSVASKLTPTENGAGWRSATQDSEERPD
jgi:hypothetical protein